MFGKKKDPKEQWVETEADRAFHEHTQREVEAAVREIMEHMNDNPVTYEQIDAGFIIGYRNAKRVYENAIEHVAEENRRLRKWNLIYKANNESLARELEELKRKYGDDDISDNGNSGDEGDELSYFELLPR